MGAQRTWGNRQWWGFPTSRLATAWGSGKQSGPTLQLGPGMGLGTTR